MSLAGICFTESKVLHQLHQALKPYTCIYFFTVLSDLEFNIAAGSLVLNSFKQVSQISCIPFHLPIVIKPEKCIKNRKLDTRVKK